MSLPPVLQNVNSKTKAIIIYIKGLKHGRKCWLQRSTAGYQKDFQGSALTYSVCGCACDFLLVWLCLVKNVFMPNSDKPFSFQNFRVWYDDKRNNNANKQLWCTGCQYTNANVLSNFPSVNKNISKDRQEAKQIPFMPAVCYQLHCIINAG